MIVFGGIDVFVVVGFCGFECLVEYCVVEILGMVDV